MKLAIAILQKHAASARVMNANNLLVAAAGTLLSDTQDMQVCVGPGKVRVSVLVSLCMRMRVRVRVSFFFG